MPKPSVTDFFRAAPRGMLVAVVIAFALLNGLGIWQLYRLQWKEHLIADLALTEAMPPVPVASLLSQAKPSWRSVTLPPCDIKPAQLIYMHSELAGEPGYRVLTPCPLQADAPEMLVDLGFTTDQRLMSLSFTPVGRLRPYEKAGMVTPVNIAAAHEWYWRSASDVSKALNMPLRSDYFLVLDLQASGVHMPGLQQGPVTAPLWNHHFDYALTWFGLGWALIGVFIAFVVQKLGKQETHSAE